MTCFNVTNIIVSYRIFEKLFNLELFKHLQSSECCRQSCSVDCFEFLHSSLLNFNLNLRRLYIHINWEKPNQQVHHVNHYRCLHFRLYILSNSLYSLKYVINFCHLLIINYPFFTQLLYSPNELNKIEGPIY